MIDWAHVDMLKDEVGPEDFDEIVALFIEEVDAFVARLSNEINPETLGDDLHFAKGCAAGLGFRTFVEQCHAGEKMCRDGLAAEVDVPVILAAYADSKRLFLDRIPLAVAS